MTDFIFTDDFEPLDSSAVDCVLYNSKTQELLVGLLKTGLCYLYTGVPEQEFSRFALAGSKGTHYAKVIKLNYGPGTCWGNLDNDVRLVPYGSQRTAAAGYPKDLTVMFPLKSEDAPVSAKQNATAEAKVHNAVSAEVVFNLGGKDATTTFEDISTVSDAVAEITKIAELLGLGSILAIKKVSVNFE